MTSSRNPQSEYVAHLHRCHFSYLGGYKERCPNMFECLDDCVEDDQETIGFCEKHERLAQELEEILPVSSKESRDDK